MSAGYTTGTGTPCPTPGDLADRAAKALRDLNRATYQRGPSGNGYADVADVASAIAGLVMVAQRLPQALEQARRWLQDQDATGLIDTDDRVPSGQSREVIAETLGDLEAAERDARDLAATMVYVARWADCLRSTDPDSDHTPSTDDTGRGAHSAAPSSAEMSW